jgi:pimeloyl-ACP methyl ester carboxylesterase
MLAAGAAALGACALYVQRQSLRAERAFPVTGRLLDVHGVRLHCIDRGDPDAAHTVAMLHDSCSLAEEIMVSGLPDQAARHHRVIVFDRPGHGLSDASHPHWEVESQADLVAAALEQLDVRRPIVLGHGYGALVALAMGLRHPQTVASLVLVSGYYFPTVRLDRAWMSLSAVPLLGPFLANTVAPLLGRLAWRPTVRRLFAPAPVSKAFRRVPKWMVLRPSQLQADAAESTRLLLTVSTLRRRYAELHVPTVLVAGAGDRCVSTLWHSSRLHELLDFSWLRIVEGAGHMPHHVATPQVLAAIDQAAAMGPSLTRVSLAGDRDGETAHRLDPNDWSAQPTPDLGRS